MRLDVRIGFETVTNFYTGVSENISGDGLFVASRVLFDIGTEVALTFSLPTGDRITVRGVVRWLRDGCERGVAWGMGVRFLDLSPQDALVIRKFVAWREPMLYEG